MRDSFVFYKSFYEAIKDLPRDIQGEIYTAIMEYSLYGNETENLKPIARSIFILIKPQIDINNKRFENGSKGGRPKRSEVKTLPHNNQVETKQKPNKNQTKTKVEPNVNDNVNVNDNIPPIIPPNGDIISIVPDVSEKIEEKEKTNSPLSKIEEEFESFRKSYPGNKRGHKVEFDNFKKKHSDYGTVVYLLSPALAKLKAWRDKKRQLGQFVPEYANLSTWLNQRRWEVEFEKIDEHDETTQTKRYDNGDFLR